MGEACSGTDAGVDTAGTSQDKLVLLVIEVPERDYREIRVRRHYSLVGGASFLFFLAHRTSTAFFAISLRRAFDKAFARARPPTNPP
jgi:hypothetical protein